MTRPCSKIAYTQHEAERALRRIQKRPVRPDQRKRFGKSHLPLPALP